MNDRKPNVPKLRFPGFTDPWEQRKLNEVVDSIDTGKSKFAIHDTGSYEILGSTSVIGYDESFDYEGDFLLTARVGANAGELYRHSGKVKISDNTVFIQGEHLDFIYYALLNFDIKRLSFGTGQPLVKASELKKQELNIPCDDKEREKIGSFFHTLDNLISLHQRKLDHLKELKKSLLLKMFPKDGETVPELRFPGFTDPWEQHKVERIASKTYGGGTPSTAVKEYWEGTIPWIQSSNLSEGKYFNIEILKHISGEAVNNSAAQIIPANSIAVVTHVGVGKLAYLDFSYTTSQDFISLAGLKTDPIFTCYSLALKLKSDLNIVQGSAIKGITKDDLLEKIIKVPSYSEQRKLGEFFATFDDFTALHERKIDHLQDLKKGLLQQMFV